MFFVSPVTNTIPGRKGSECVAVCDRCGPRRVCRLNMDEASVTVSCKSRAQ